ncbi:multidrug efflux pump subunit AcrB [Clostridium beijerinckii]|nr:multidrug efflux pump subunit AcrB [Clostridium beijerinckii]
MRFFETASAQLTRYDRLAELQISCNISGSASGTFMNTFMKKIQTQMNMPEGISVSLGGAGGSMTSSLASLEQAMAMAALFLYLVMAAQFESFVDPISILFSLPLAIIGAVFRFICLQNSIKFNVNNRYNNAYGLSCKERNIAYRCS